MMLEIGQRLESRPGLRARGAEPRSVLVGCPFCNGLDEDSSLLAWVLGLWEGPSKQSDLKRPCLPSPRCSGRLSHIGAPDSNSERVIQVMSRKARPRHGQGTGDELTAVHLSTFLA